MKQRPHLPQGPLCVLDRPDRWLPQNALEHRNNRPATCVDLCRSLEPGSENLNQVNCRDTCEVMVGGVPKGI